MAQKVKGCPRLEELEKRLLDTRKEINDLYEKKLKKLIRQYPDGILKNCSGEFSIGRGGKIYYTKWNDEKIVLGKNINLAKWLKDVCVAWLYKEIRQTEVE